MRILFIGGTYSEQMEQDILENTIGNGHIQNAANKFQLNLIEGFRSQRNIELDILSLPFVASFPAGYKKFFYRSRSCFESKNATKYIDFVNIVGLKNISRENRLSRELTKYFRNDSSAKTIVVYSAHNPFLQAAISAKKANKDIHICLIIPDLPQYMNLEKNKTSLYSFFKKYDTTLFYDSLEDVDSFVVLTSHMRKVLNIENKPSIVIEGVVNRSEYNVKSSNQDIFKLRKSNTIVYTGTLNEKFGIKNLVDAFMMIPKHDIKLRICGSGDSEEYIKTKSNIDPRIEFLGKLSLEESITIQKKASILINPRQNNESYTKFSFPSKTMEYLLTGNPIIAYKLDGIPDEYDPYIYYVEDNSVEALVKKINEVLEVPAQQNQKKGADAINFVLENKNNDFAAKRIISLFLK